MAGTQGMPAEVTAAQVARMAGVARGAVSNWRRRYPDFPGAGGRYPCSPDVLAAGGRGMAVGQRQAGGDLAG